MGRPKKIGGKDSINLKQFLVWMALGVVVVFALLWAFIDPALAIFSASLLLAPGWWRKASALGLSRQWACRW